MSGCKLTGDWAGLSRKFAAMASPGLFARATRRIAEYGVSSTKLRFQDQKGPDGRPWLPSQRAWLTGGKTLIDTGRLQGSITGRSDATSAEWGTNVVYAAAHQFGGVLTRGRRGGGLPARPFIGLNKDDQAEIDRIVLETMAEAG